MVEVFMAAYVLVHGGNMSTDAWNNLAQKPVYPPGERLGGKVWDPVVPGLQKEGYRVFAPTLADEWQSSLTEHIEQIITLIDESELKQMLLVAHSYGGMVITGVADRIPEKIVRLVYVDAALPDSGQSLFDIIVSARCDPASFVGLAPDKPYMEKLFFDGQKLKAIPKTYMRCKYSDFAPVTDTAKQKIAAAPGEWTYIELPSSHVPMASMPEALTRLLIDAAKQ